MPAYTVYRLNGTSRISEPPNYIAADTDEEAIEFPRDKKLKVRCEVWEGGRLVARIDAHPPSA